MSASDLDPFDLPEWVATEQVVWRPAGPLDAGHHLVGELTRESGEPLPCDLLAVDSAYPRPVADDALRTKVHRAWHHGQVHTVTIGGRLTLAVPGVRPDVEQVLHALARLGLAVGAPPSHLSAWLSLGDTDRDSSGR